MSNLEVPSPQWHGSGLARTSIAADGKERATNAIAERILLGRLTTGRGQRSRKPGRLAIKRAIDVVVALLAIVTLLPIFAAIALFIRCGSHGPAVFAQARVGLGGHSFRMFKFRTMHVEQCDVSGVQQATENDARVTPLGRILRRTSLDELPQLFNVLLGSMSLVGPRPHVAEMLAADRPYEELVPRYPERTLMKPGLTGLAQSLGFRGPTTNEHTARMRIELDLAYVEDFSLWLDVKILLWTLRHELLVGHGV